MNICVSFFKKGSVGSGTTYDRLLIFGDTIPVLTFPVFKVGQPEEAPDLLPASPSFTPPSVPVRSLQTNLPN